VSEVIILPENFKRPRYMDGWWIAARIHWTAEDLTLLSAACDLGISCHAAANTLGRPPASLVDKAYHSGIRVPKRWREFVYTPRKRSPRLNLNYPYIVQPTEHHADIIAVHRMVSRAIPGREDLCQDIMLALWENRTSLDELRSDPRALKAFVKSFRKAHFERSGYGIESMDVTIHSDGGKGKSKYEDARYQRTLANNDDQFIENMIFGKGYTGDFADRTIEEISREEESLGVPAAFWMRSSPSFS